ncbi:MAG: GAF domain-containing protein, partial [Bacteroidia bacterium]|nr:GAF domain-containing protein [Bacteroidia bacterium]
ASVSGIAQNLLVKTEDGFEKIKRNIRHLFGNSELEIGLVSYENKVFTKTHKDNVESILMRVDEQLDCTTSMCSYTYDQLINKKVAFIVPDVEAFDKRANSGMSNRIKKAGLGSYIMAPLMHNDEFLGFLELGSKNKNELNTFSNYKLDRIIPIISMAASRFKEETRNRIEAIIQQECTTIHPSVKWRFEEAAYKYLVKVDAGKHSNFKDIVFKDVYPLYGQLDIKGSSTKRNDAVTADLITQVDLIKNVLKVALKNKKLPILEELIFRIETYRKEIKEGLLAGSEHKILGFMKQEIYPVFKHLKKNHPSLKPAIEKYSASLDETLNIVYDERKKFDESVGLVNQVLAGYIDEMQADAQKMFPHYFERYKTDGVEYNMYIGQSMSQNDKFNSIYLKNLRLWQLLTQCEMEGKMHELRKTMSTKLEVASLILVYNTPLSIHFRMDEKRFDVEGAYNARYEIVKKRVDKAHIKNTKERITQPGKIAIIYTNEQDAYEYKKYISYLENKGYLIPNSLEDLELENLQGISGLKSLRVSVAYDMKSKTSVTMDEIMQEIRK